MNRQRQTLKPLKTLVFSVCLYYTVRAHTGNNLSDALHGLINLSSGSTKELTISCRYLKRTIYHLEKNGATFRYDNAKYDSAGNMNAIDFSDAPEDFSIRLIEKH